MSPVELVRAQLEARGCATRGPDHRFEAICPAHEDRNPSLSVTEGDGSKALLHCHTGCEIADILAALGLDERDLFVHDDRPEPMARRAAPAPSFSEKDGHLDRIGEVAGRLFELRGWTMGALEGSDIGFDGDRLRFLECDGDDRIVAVCRYQPNPERREGPKLIALKGSQRDLFYAPRRHDCEERWICEGAADALALASMGFSAVGFPGTGKWDESWPARIADGCQRVVVVSDCDGAGRKAAERLAPAVSATGVEVRVLDLDRARSDGYDVGDALRECVQDGDPVPELAGLLAASAAQLDPWKAPPGALVAENPPLVAVPQQEPWPEMASTALQGLPGRFVQMVSPHSEADEAALLVSFLLAAGNAMGRAAFFEVEGTRHGTNINAVIVGQSSKARKGTSWGQVRRVFELADEDWARNRVLSGLSSGEGLIHQVRDPEVKHVPKKKDGKPTGEYEEQVVDMGVEDKRLCVVEGEFARVLKAMEREGNTLSPIIREAYDSGNLRSLTKSAPGVATNSLISVLGHITQAELRKRLHETEAANGFFNRFLPVLSKRSKSLPRGGSLTDDQRQPLALDLREALRFASVAGRVEPDAEAWDLWERIYDELSAGADGLFGAVTARGEAHTMRLAMIYALLDRSDVIHVGHLKAALAVWDYCQRSAAVLFGGIVGDEVADRILTFITTREPEGASRTDLRDLFDRHLDAKRLDGALAHLESLGLIHHRRVQTGGRPADWWYRNPPAPQDRDQSPESATEALLGPSGEVRDLLDLTATGMTPEQQGQFVDRLKSEFDATEEAAA